LQYIIFKYCVSKFSSVKNFLHSIILYNFSKVSDFIAIAFLKCDKRCILAISAGVTGKMTPAFVFAAGDGGFRASDGGVRASDGGVRAGDGGFRASDGGVRASDGGVRASDGGVRASDGGVRAGDGGFRAGRFCNKAMYFQYFNIFHKLNLI
jgi:hypothetical protein